MMVGRILQMLEERRKTDGLEGCGNGFYTEEESMEWIADTRMETSRMDDGSYPF